MGKLNTDSRRLKESLEAYKAETGKKPKHLPEEESPEHIFIFEVDATAANPEPLMRFVSMVRKRFTHDEEILWFAYSIHNEIRWREWLKSIGQERKIKSISFRLTEIGIRDLTIRNYSGRKSTYPEPSLYRVLYRHRFVLNTHTSPPP